MNVLASCCQLASFNQGIDPWISLSCASWVPKQGQKVIFSAEVSGKEQGSLPFQLVDVLGLKQCIDYDHPSHAMGILARCKNTTMNMDL